jgi:predicted HAD superfamily Cof-like phosphohydrolase
MSNYESVKQFTQESTGIECPETPIPMNKQEVLFLTKMVLSELTELMQTVTDTHEDAINELKNCIGVDPSKQPENKDPVHIIAHQADAMVDAWYYMLNASAKKGINLSLVFDAVHQANMDKRDPSTGRFLRRTDGKIIKPHGWKEADIIGLIQSQIKTL